MKNLYKYKSKSITKIKSVDMETKIEKEEAEAIEDIKKEENNKQQIELILIDGLSGSGKTTLASYLAYGLNSCYFDTGKVVRLISAYLLHKGLQKGKDMKYEIIDMVKMMPDIKIHFDLCNREINASLDIDGTIASPILKYPIQNTTDNNIQISTKHTHVIDKKEVEELASIIATYSCIKERLLMSQNDVINHVIKFNNNNVESCYTCNYIIFVANNLVQYGFLKMHNIFITAHINKRAIRRFADIIYNEQHFLSSLGYNSNDILNFKQLKAFYKSVRSSLRYADLRVRAIEDTHDKIISTKAFIIDTTYKNMRECCDMCIEHISRNTDNKEEINFVSLEQIEQSIGNIFKKPKRKYIRRNAKLDTVVIDPIPVVIEPIKVNKTCNLYTEFSDCESCG